MMMMRRRMVYSSLYDDDGDATLDVQNRWLFNVLNRYKFISGPAQWTGLYGSSYTHSLLEGSMV